MRVGVYFSSLVLAIALGASGISTARAAPQGGTDAGGGIANSPGPQAGSTGVTSGPTASIPASSSPASSLAAASPLVPWSDETAYQQCGQTCLLKKANETLTMQALYIGYRIKDMRELWEQASSTGKYDQLMTEIHDYCPDVELQGASEPDAKKCLRNYVLSQIPVLRSIKTAIADNLNNTLAYRADVVSVAADGTIQRRPVSAFKIAVQTSAQLPQTTYVPSLKDLKAEQALLQAQNQQQNYFASETYEQWYQQSKPVQPNQDDFIMWKTVPIDPNDPSQGSVSVPQTENGQTKYDQKAYQQALKEYTVSLARFQSLATGKYGKSASPVNEPPTKSATEDYKQAYQDYVHQNNSYILSQGVAVISAGPRAPAAASDGLDGTLVQSDQKGGVSGETPVQPAPVLTHTELTKSFTPSQVDDLIGAQTDFLTKVLKYAPPN